MNSKAGETRKRAVKTLRGARRRLRQRSDKLAAASQRPRRGTRPRYCAHSVCSTQRSARASQSGAGPNQPRRWYALREERRRAARAHRQLFFLSSAAETMSQMRCSNPECRSTDIDWNESSGDAVCVRCGTVCEESTIVASVEFTEGAGGSGVVGQFAQRSARSPSGRSARTTGLWETQVRLST